MFLKLGMPFGSPQNKEYNILGSILEILLIWETTIYGLGFKVGSSGFRFGV